MFASAANWGWNALIANEAVAGSWETFSLVYVGTNAVAFKAAVNGDYVDADSNGDPLIANSSTLGIPETFEWYKLSNGDIALRSCASGMLVCADLNNANPGTLVANRTDHGSWESFAVSTH